MYRYLLIGFLICMSMEISAQQVSNFVMIGPRGATDDPNEATNLVVVKQYPDSIYERLDYKMQGPMTKSRRYKGVELKMLDGEYLEYDAAGRLIVEGRYAKNQKTGTWNRFNDTGKVISSEKYLMDSLVETVDLTKKDSSVTYPDEKESEYPNGVKRWLSYISNQLGKSNVAATTTTGGTVIVDFIVDSGGTISYARIYKSVEFLLDNESLRIINESPKWKPAFENGKNVKSYKRQPITFRPY